MCFTLKIIDLVLKRNGNENRDETKVKRLSERYNEINFEEIKIKEELLITLSQKWDELVKRLYEIKWHK